MIIFNILSLFIFILSLLTIYLVKFIDPDLGGVLNSYFWFIMMFYACIAVAYSLKPRVYLIPLWLFSFLIIIWLNTTKFGFWGFLLSLSIGGMLITLGVILKIKLDQKRWQRSKSLLEHFLINNPISNPNRLIFYPSHIYPQNVILENRLDSFFISLQRKWFKKQDVQNHYLQIIDKLNDLSASEKEKNKNNYLKTILEGDMKNGVQEFQIQRLIEQLDKLKTR